MHSPSDFVHAAEPLRGKVLVVEDEVAALDALGELLQGWGFEVALCADGASVRERLTGAGSDSFDLLLSDVLLSDHSGIELALLANAISPLTRVLLMSSYVPDDLKLKSEWQFIRKPLREFAERSNGYRRRISGS